MPNHVTNHVRIGVNTEVISVEDFLKKIGADNDNGVVINFENIIAPPDDPAYRKEGLTSEDRASSPNNWYDWNVANWGTKWNAYSQELVDVDEYEVELRFDTAWSPPFPIIAELRRWPEIEWIGGNYIEEFCESAGVF